MFSCVLGSPISCGRTHDPNSVRGGDGVYSFREEHRLMKIVLNGQIPSGKNSVKTTRTGHRYPNQRFVGWREDAFCQIREQVPHYKAFSGPTMALFSYFPGDLRRRDVPGMVDALFHVLERFGLIVDDSLFQQVCWVQMPIDRDKPRVVINLEPMGEK